MSVVLINEKSWKELEFEVIIKKESLIWKMIILESIQY